MAWAGGAAPSPTTSCGFSAKTGSLERLKPRRRWGARPCVFPIFRTVETARPRGRDANRPGHGSRRPVGRLMRRRLQRHRYDGGRPVVGYRRPAGRPGLVVKQALTALRHEPHLPAPNRGLRLSRRRHDGIRADAGGARQRDLRAPDMFLRGVAAGNESVEPLTVSLDTADGYSCAHAPNADAHRSMGIPDRTVPSRPIH
jgi:hypothetical protein